MIYMTFHMALGMVVLFQNRWNFKISIDITRYTNLRHLTKQKTITEHMAPYIDAHSQSFQIRQINFNLLSKHFPETGVSNLPPHLSHFLHSSDAANCRNFARIFWFLRRRRRHSQENKSFSSSNVIWSLV